jgi:hypothetical protein
MIHPLFLGGTRRANPCFSAKFHISLIGASLTETLWRRCDNLRQQARLMPREKKAGRRRPAFRYLDV